MPTTIIRLCVIALLLSACLGGESNVESGSRDQILHFGNYGEPSGLDPHLVTGVPESRITGALFEGLVTKNPETLIPEPGVASEWTISDDGRTYLFTIRNDAKWSNGDPVTAHDFAWSWWRALQPALGSQYVFMYFAIKNAERFFTGELSDFNAVGIKALDDHTLKVELANPTPYFLQLLDHQSMFPVHRATIEAFGKADESYTRWTRPENIVSNGAFRLEDWRLFKVLSVVRNEHYWNKDKVALNGIRFYPIDKQTTEERMFRAGQLHRTEEVPLERIPWYRKEQPQRIRIEPYVGTYFYRLNTRVAALSDQRVRRALALSVDRSTLIDTVLNGIYTPAYAVTPPGLLGYQPPTLLNYNPEEARSLMAAAGYPNGKGFPEIELQYNTHDQHRKIAIAVQQMWKDELNISVRIQNKDWKVYLNEEVTGNYELSRGSWIGDYVDPNTFLDMWTTGGGHNKTGFASSEFDELVLQTAPRAKTHEERLEVFYQAEELLMEQVPILPIFTYASKHLVHESVLGLTSNYMDFVNFRYVSLQPQNTSMDKTMHKGNK
ncbi:MAG: peptide ABC transporter substrate-binding protein [Pseudomonadales bacterium]